MQARKQARGGARLTRLSCTRHGRMDGRDIRPCHRSHRRHTCHRSANLGEAGGTHRPAADAALPPRPDCVTVQRNCPATSSSRTIALKSAARWWWWWRRRRVRSTLATVAVAAGTTAFAAAATALATLYVASVVWSSATTERTAEGTGHLQHSTHLLQQHCIYRALQHVVLCFSTPFNTIVINHVHSTAQHGTARHGTARHTQTPMAQTRHLSTRKHDRRSGRSGQTWTIQRWAEGWSVCAMRPADSPFQP